jgi:hypothetical protein
LGKQDLKAMLDAQDDFSPEAINEARIEAKKRGGVDTFTASLDGIKEPHPVSVGAAPDKKKKEPTIDRFHRFNGTGTTVLGKRDFLLDGTYITTAWLTVCWIPVAPLESYRISSRGLSSFLIHEVLPLNRKQVAFTYSYAILYVGCFVFACCYCIPSDGVGLLYAIMLAPILIPMSLRYYARRKVRVHR